MTIETVNLHVWPKCNLKCVYCYGTFPARPRVLSQEGWARITSMLADAGVRRVTFSGGEPTLHPAILPMVEHARSVGLGTAIITNGAKVSDELLAALDLVGATVDSGRTDTLARLGRGAGYLATVRDLARRAHAAGARLKLNTVVCALNADEDLASLVQGLSPWKWKPLQFTEVVGENDAAASSLQVSRQCFDGFVARHRAALAGTPIWFAPESDATIRRTYVMIDPEGRVFQHGADGHRVSAPIEAVGFVRAVAEVGGYDRDAFLARGGDVDVRRLPVFEEREP